MSGRGDDEGNDAANDVETGVPDGGDEAQPGTEPTEAPRARRPRASRVAAEDVGAPFGVFGIVPAGVKHWRVTKLSAHGEKSPIGWAPPGAVAELKEFPIAELSEQTIADRWGPGVYEVSWVRFNPDGGRNVLRGTSGEIRIVGGGATSAPAPAVPNPIADHLAFMRIVEERSTSKLTDVLELARFFREQAPAAPAAGVVTLDGLRLLMREEREAAATATNAAIAAAVEPLRAQLAELTEDDEDDEDEEDVASKVARSAGSRLFKGNKWYHLLGAYASENPDVVKAALPVVVGAVQNIAAAVSSAVSAQPPPPARPRAQIAQLVPQPLPPQPQPAPVAVAPSPPPVEPVVVVEPDAPPAAVAQTADAAE